LSDGFDDLFGNGSLEPEKKIDGKLPALGLVVAPRARSKAECGYDELKLEEQAYLAQIREHGRFVPDFEDADEDEESSE
jgi:hypothetical protein